MSAHDFKLFGDAIAATRLETKFAGMKATSLLRLAIEDLFPGRIALVSSFGADSAVLLHMISGIDKAIPVVFVPAREQDYTATLVIKSNDLTNPTVEVVLKGKCLATAFHATKPKEVRGIAAPAPAGAAVASPGASPGPSPSGGTTP